MFSWRDGLCQMELERVQEVVRIFIVVSTWIVRLLSYKLHQEAALLKTTPENLVSKVNPDTVQNEGLFNSGTTPSVWLWRKIHRTLLLQEIIQTSGWFILLSRLILQEWSQSDGIHNQCAPKAIFLSWELDLATVSRMLVLQRKKVRLQHIQW